jgi:asparagine synthase (glutamine-hydrolysing)
VFFDRAHDELAGVVDPAFLHDADVSSAFVADHFARPGLTTTVDRALRIDTQVMLAEDPVKRVDNMTMAFGLEARVPFLDHELVELAFACPTELELAGGGKGVLKDLARTVLPADLIDRPKGYFPVPPLVQLGPDAVSMLGDALRSPAARERGVFREDHVTHLLEHPQELTALKYNQLWELGVLELWLQTHGIG